MQAGRRDSAIDFFGHVVPRGADVLGGPRDALPAAELYGCVGIGCAGINCMSAGSRRAR